MPDIQQQTAILIFANSSQKEVLEKSIPNGESLFDHLNQQTYQVAQETGLDVIVYSEDFQKGNNFGERFSNAIENVFSRGYQQVITIGNDSPNLQSSDLIEAHKNLSKRFSTIGPSLDGGTYLIAIHQDSFQKEDFIMLPWQTSSLRKSLHTYLEKRNDVVRFLSYKKDIDSFQDLHHFLNSFQKISSDFRQILKLLIREISVIFTQSILIISQLYSSTFFNKGSPA